MINTREEKVLIRGGESTEAKRNNIILLAKELAIETDTLKMKVGDGITPYNKLPYLPYTEITKNQMALWIQAHINSLSWVNSPAYNITLTDILNWNSASGVVGPTVDIVAAENIPAYSFVTSQGYIADSSNITMRDKIIGISLLPINIGFSGTVQMLGEVTNPGWSFTTGQVLFLNGQNISATPPSVGFVIKLGTAKSFNQIVVEIGTSILL